MTETEPVANFLLRDVIRKCWPDLLAEHHQRWEAWRNCPEKRPGAKFQRFMCTLTCFEDLEIAFALGQIAEVDWIDPHFIFILPTAPAATLFKQRAYGQGINGRIEVYSRNDIPKFPAEEILVLPAACLVDEHYARSLATSTLPLALPIEARLSNICVGVSQDLGIWSLATFFKQSDQSERKARALIDTFRTASSGYALQEPDALGIHQNLIATCQASADEGYFKIDLEFPDGAVSRHAALKINGLTVWRRPLERTSAAYSLQPELPLANIGVAWQDCELILKLGEAQQHIALSMRLPPSRLRPEMVTCYLNRGGAGNPMIRDMAKGIGCALRYAEDEVMLRPGVPIVWGVLRGSDNILAMAKAAGQYFFYIDHAYFARGHGKNYRITRNGYEAGRIRKVPQDRAEALGLACTPWQQGGKTILICPPTEYFMNAHGCSNWLEETITTLKGHTDRPLAIRNKPAAGEVVEPLEEAFAKAHALVTHSSNVAIEAVMAGLPVFVAPSSAAAPMGLTDLSQIEAPVRPDRAAWLAHLAYSQFSSDEIASGAAWRMLLDFEEMNFLESSG